MGLSRDLKLWVSPSIRLKQLCHLNSLKENTEMPYCNMPKPLIFITHFIRYLVFYMSDLSLNVFQSKAAHNKPELEGTERFPEAQVPVL